MSQSKSIWTKNFVLILLSNLLVFVSHYFLVSSLPLYVTEGLKGNEKLAGYVIGIYCLTSVITRPLSGYMLDNIGRKKIVLSALLMYILCLKYYAFTASIFVLLVLRGIQGLFWGFTSTGLGTIAADLIPSGKRGEGMGYYGLSSTIAMAIGPSLALIIIKESNFSSLINTGVVFGVLALLSVMLINYDGNKKISGDKKTKIGVDDFFEKEVMWLSGIMFFISTTFGAIIAFIIIYGNQIGISSPEKFFLIYSMVLLFTRPFAGKAFDKNGPLKIMGVGFICGILGFILLFLSNGELLFDLAAVFIGLMHGICAPSIIAMAINRVDDSKRGKANGTILSAQDLGMAFGPIALGTLSNVIGISFMYLVCGFIMIVPIVIFYSKESIAYKKSVIDNQEIWN